MKKTIMILLVLLSIAALPALAETPDVSGDWYADLGGAAVTLTLREDGTYALTAPAGESLSGAWTLNDGFIFLDGSDAPDLALWGEDTLRLSSGEGFLTREKPAPYAPAEPVAGASAAPFSGYWKAAFVDVNGTPVPAALFDDATDLYIEGTHAILGGPLFGDTLVAMTFENGALTGETEGLKAMIELLKDGALRLTVTGTETAPQVFYLRISPAGSKGGHVPLSGTPSDLPSLEGKSAR